MALIRNTLRAVKGLNEELDLRIHRVNDLVTDVTTIDGSAGFNDKLIGANAVNTALGTKVNTSEINTDVDLTVEPTKLTTRETVASYVDSKVATVSTKYINEIVTLSGDEATLANQPLDNCIFNFSTARVDLEDGSFEIVPCSVDSAKKVTITPDTAEEYDGKKITVTYAYNA